MYPFQTKLCISYKHLCIFYQWKKLKYAFRANIFFTKDLEVCGGVFGTDVAVGLQII